MTDYSKLQQIGQDSTTGGYDWANATIDVIANAQNGAAQGMLINFYRTLLPYKWFVYWCSDRMNTALWVCLHSSQIRLPLRSLHCTAVPLLPQAYLYAGVHL